MLLTKLEERSVPRVLKNRDHDEPEAPQESKKKSPSAWFLPKRLFFQTAVISTVLVTIAIVGFSVHIVRDEIKASVERVAQDGVVLAKNISLAVAAQMENGTPESNCRVRSWPKSLLLACSIDYPHCPDGSKSLAGC